MRFFLADLRVCVYVLHSSSFVAAAKLVFVSYEEDGDIKNLARRGSQLF